MEGGYRRCGERVPCTCLIWKVGCSQSINRHCNLFLDTVKTPLQIGSYKFIMLRTGLLVFLIDIAAAHESFNFPFGAGVSTGNTTTANLGGFAPVVPWISHVFLGIGALTFTLTGIPRIFDGAFELALAGPALDPVLKEAGVNGANIYEKFASIDDPVIKSLCFWAIFMLRGAGCYQLVAGIALWCCIFLVPMQHRAAPHFIYAVLQTLEAGLEASCGWGWPFGKDTVILFGGTQYAPKSATAPEGAKTFSRPKTPPWTHAAFAVVNWALGVCALLV